MVRKNSSLSIGGRGRCRTHSPRKVVCPKTTQITRDGNMILIMDIDEWQKQ
jgi:hypothetical protein